MEGQVIIPGIALAEKKTKAILMGGDGEWMVVDVPLPSPTMLKLNVVRGFKTTERIFAGVGSAEVLGVRVMFYKEHETIVLAREN